MTKFIRSSIVLVSVLAIAASCNPWNIFGPSDDDSDEVDAAFGYVEIWDRFSTPLTDRLPDRTGLTSPATWSEGSGIGTAASEPQIGIGIMVGNVDPASPCAAVGRTCVVTQGSSTQVSMTFVSSSGGIAQWIAVGGEVTVESLSPVRFRFNNLQMRVAPYEGNAADGSFWMKGVVGAR